MPPSHHDIPEPLNERRTGALVAIGGNEDRSGDLDVLRHTLQAAHAAPPHRPLRVAVLTTASTGPQRQWQTYERAFGMLQAEPDWLDIRDRNDAETPARLAQIEAADLVFMTGGDQERLVRALHGSATHRLMLQRQRHAGLAVAGTSAGASALGTLMPGGDLSDDGDTVFEPTHDDIPRGLGFIQGVVIDQHFAQRRRLARLITLACRRPGLAGLGLDEDTAAIIRPGPSLTVVGRGSATLVDCRHAQPVQGGQPLVSLRSMALHRASAGVTLRPNAGLRPEAGRRSLHFAALLP